MNVAEEGVLDGVIINGQRETIERILIPEGAIAARIRALGAQITADYPG